MNISQALKIIKSRKYQALEKAEMVKNIISENSDMNILNIKINELTISGAKGDENAYIERSRVINALNQLLKPYNICYEDINTQYYCKKCNDNGYINGHMCSCLRELLNSDDIVTESEICFNNAKKGINDTFIEICKKYSNGNLEKNNMFICGGSGSGKTFAVMSIANELRAQRKDVIFLTAFELNQIFLEIYLSDVNKNIRLWKKLLDTEYLIIDDLGTEQSRQNVTDSSLFNLYNQRELRRKHTVTTTNLEPDELKTKYRERLFSRLTNQNNTLVIKLKNKDLRQMRQS